MRLRTEIAKHQLSQSEVARRAGLNEDAISQIVIRGAAHVQSIGKLAAALGLEPADLSPDLRRTTDEN